MIIVEKPRKNIAEPLFTKRYFSALAFYNRL